MTVTPGKSARAARAVEALMARHAELREVLDHWAGARAAAISALFASHVAKEDCLLLPALERSGADLAALLAREPRLTDIQCAA